MGPLCSGVNVNSRISLQGLRGYGKQYTRLVGRKARAAQGEGESRVVTFHRYRHQETLCEVADCRSASYSGRELLGNDR